MLEYIQREARINYCIRTMEHIQRVQKWGLYLLKDYQANLDLNPRLREEFIVNLRKHDASKLTEIQIDGYSQYFSEAIENTPEIYTNHQKAWENHYTVENHHPIGFAHGVYDQKNYSIIGYEIACDLQAVADEFNAGSCRKYYEEKWIEENSKYIADDSWQILQEDIERCIECFETITLKRGNGR